jgi:hypothetical protein
MAEMVKACDCEKREIGRREKRKEKEINEVMINVAGN